MVHLSTLSLVAITAALTSVHGVPMSKRISETIDESTQQFFAACLAAGGGQQCNPLSVVSFQTLLFTAQPCDQQNAADSMVDLAHKLNNVNSTDMIKYAQIFAQQPRNSPDALSVPYCQQAPKNSELNGLYQCQWQGSNKQTFLGNIALGKNGTIPFGHAAPISPPGSCPASPNGPIPDGSQLVSITQNPGVSSSGSQTVPEAGSTSIYEDTTDTASADSDTANDATTSSSDSHPQNGEEAPALNSPFSGFFE